jgi:hypothetical protein
MQFKLSGAEGPLLLSGPPFSLSFTVSGRVRGALTRPDLENALERLRRRHPFLAVRVVAGKDGEPACLTSEGVPPIPLRVVERMGDQDWAGEVEHEIPRPSDYRTGPPFRCVWLRGAEVSDLVLVCDHLTADGRAGIYALRDLLSLLADPGLELEPLEPAPLRELLPPAMLSRITEIISTAALSAPAGAAWRPEPVPAEPLRVLPFELNETETATLVARSRLEGATVQAALCAAFVLPFAERQPDVPVRRVESPVDIRGRLARPLGEVYADYISLVLLSLDCAPGRGAWEIARQARRILAEVTDEQLFTVPTLMMMVSDQPLTMPPIDFCYDLSISNLGRIDIPAQYGRLCLESIYAPTMNVSEAGHRILGVSTFAGRLRATFTSRDPQAPQLLQRARQVLAGMLN